MWLIGDSLQSYANVTEKQPCIFELSTYPGIDASGLEYVNTIVRDNCQTARFFCNTTTQVCEPLRTVGQPCRYHRDCKSVRLGLFCNVQTLRQTQYTCFRNVCASPPEEPFQVALWHYAVTTLAVFLGIFFLLRFIKMSFVDSWMNSAAMAAICIMLVMIHRRHRLKHYQEISDYCDEQLRHVFS